MFIHSIKRFIDALWPSQCIACDSPSNLEIFCRHCKPSIKTAESEAIFLFTGAIREVIQQAKFSPNESKARELMRYTQTLSFSLPQENLDGIVFIPVHWRRRLQRGFDLSALFAIMLSKQLQLPIFDWLINTRFDKPLTLSHSKAEREALTNNRYQVGKKNPKNKKILLVDDVTTTGTTLEAAKRVLSAAGHQVNCYALAKTPLKK